MPSFAADYDRRATPNSHLWFCVETPQVFLEYKLPASSTDWTNRHWRQFNQLEALAERHRTHIQRNTYRRG